jgi:hypothetical protein
MRFLDEASNELTYWPISGLRQGQYSAVLVVGVEDVPAAASLTVTADSRVSVLARRQGTADPFVNIAASPVDLSGFAGPIAWFEMKLLAAADITGAPRVALTPGAFTNSPADWRA